MHITTTIRYHCYVREYKGTFGINVKIQSVLISWDIMVYIYIYIFIVLFCSEAEVCGSFAGGVVLVAAKYLINRSPLLIARFFLRKVYFYDTGNFF